MTFLQHKSDHIFIPYILLGLLISPLDSTWRQLHDSACLSWAYFAPFCLRLFSSLSEWLSISILGCCSCSMHCLMRQLCSFIRESSFFSYYGSQTFFEQDSLRWPLRPGLGSASEFCRHIFLPHHSRHHAQNCLAYFLVHSQQTLGSARPGNVFWSLFVYVFVWILLLTHNWFKKCLHWWT